MSDPTRTLDLIRRAQAGDEAALNWLVEHYYERVRRIVRAKLGPKLRRLADSTDIVQNTMIKAVQNWTNYDAPDEQSVIRLLAQIAQRQITDMADWQGAKKRDVGRDVSLTPAADSDDPKIDPAASDTGALDRQIRRERQEMVDACLHKLPDKYRELIVARDYEGGSWKEVAEQTGHPSDNAARMAYGKAMLELVKLIRRNGGMDSTTDLAE